LLVATAVGCGGIIAALLAT